MLRKLLTIAGTRRRRGHSSPGRTGAEEGHGRRYTARGPAGGGADSRSDHDSNDVGSAGLSGPPADGWGASNRPRSTPPERGSGSRSPKIRSPAPRRVGLHVTLGNLSRAWAPPDSEGISVIDPDPARWNEFEIIWRTHTSPWWLGELELIPDPDHRRPFVLRPKTLAAYMAISAAASLYRKAKMRRCAHCGSWFEFVRAHAQFCSLSCRSLAHDSRRT